MISRRRVVAAGASSQSGSGWGAPGVGGGGVTPFFEESFLGGVKNNAGGFEWNAIAQNNGTVSVSSDRAYNGTHSLKVSYNSGTTGNYSEPTQFFRLGREIPEVWIEWYQWFPSDYEHGSGSPSNNKFMRIWSGVYTEAVNKMGLSYWKNGTVPSRSDFRGDRVTVVGPPVQTGPNSPPSESPTVALPTNTYGQWNQIRQHYKVRSSAGTDDSRIRLWINGTQLMDWTGTGAPYDTIQPYFDRGYVLGASNGFDQVTTFYLDAFKFYDADPGWV